MKIIKIFLLFAYSFSIQANNIDDSNRVFDWAELKYQHLFPSSKVETEKIDDYLVRYYPSTNNYIGTKTNDVYVYGKAFGGLVRVGKISDFITHQKFEDPTILGFISLNANGLYSEVNNINADNYANFYKRIKNLTTPNISDFITSFSYLKQTSGENIEKSATAKKRINKSYECSSEGSTFEMINLVDRGFTADTFKAGDEHKFLYLSCNMGNAIYNGQKQYHVEDFSGFDFSKVGAGAPMGAFHTSYSDYSMETNTQKTTLTGSFVYRGSAIYPDSNKAPASLNKSIETEGDSIVSFLNKENDTKIILTFNGILEKIVYTKKLTTENEFTYCITKDYELTIEENNESTNIKVADEVCGDVASGFSNILLPSKQGTPLASFVITTDSSGNPIDLISAFILADGSQRYNFYQNFTSWPVNPTATVDSIETLYELPQTDNGLNLMNGVVVFAYEGCPYFKELVEYLDSNNIIFTYIDIRNTTIANKKAFDWFDVSGVPFTGINGNFFLGYRPKMFIGMGLIQQ